MSIADEYRSHAEECFRMASRMCKPEERAAWMALASMWLKRLRALTQ